MMILCCVVHTKLYLRIQCLPKTNPNGMETVSISLQIQCLQFGNGKSCFKMKILTVCVCVHLVLRVLGDLIYDSVTYELFVEMQTGKCGAATVYSTVGVVFCVCVWHCWQRRHRLSCVKGHKGIIHECVSFV